MAEPGSLEQALLAEITQIRAIDVHSHVPAAAPFARSLRELLGYHYYTELAHSAGLDKEALDAGRPDEEMIPALLEAMAAIDNTVQYGWMLELAADLFEFRERRLTPSNWAPLAESVRRNAGRPGRAREIMDASKIERVFLTNSFEEDLSGIDTALFVPSLRADALVFNMDEPGVRDALSRVSGVAVSDGEGLTSALAAVVEHFKAHGARSAAISLPPHFAVVRAEAFDFEKVFQKCLRGSRLDETEREVLSSGILFALTALCRDCGLPCQIMYGALREAYTHGVPQGRDLPQAGDSLRGLLPLFNAFPDTVFCLSVLSGSQAQELGSYGWILQNVVLSGHWWYANIPEYIAFELAGRLQSVPKTKLIGYYSDAYKLEFALAKFNMYRRVLAHVLAGHFVEPGYGSEEDALQIARLLLRDNPIRIFSLEDPPR